MRSLSRRTVLGGLAAAAVGGAIVVGAGAMAGQRYETMLGEQLRPLDASGGTEELVRAATLAASSHNTQPWRFRPDRGAIGIEPDFSRRTPVVDPDDHHLFASLGCAAENLSIASRRFGRSGEVAVDDAGTIAVATDAAAASETPLFEAIVHRQCSRTTYDGSGISQVVLERLHAQAHTEGVDLSIVTDMQRREAILELVLAGNRAQLGDAAFRAEVKSWLRFNRDTAARAGDGLLSAASGNPSLPDWLGPFMYDLTISPDGDSDRVAAQVRSSSGLAVFSADRDEPAGWVAAGRAYQRFALAATVEGLQHAFINQAVEVPAVRAQLQSLLGLGSRRANLVVRFGHGPQLPRSLRRPLVSVMAA